MDRRTLVSFALLATLLSRRAGATPGFPAEIQAHLGLTYTPACTVCHVGTPGPGTATTPFAVTLEGFGLVPYDNASLDTALDDDRASNTSSAGDGVSDIQKLENGEDPNAYAGDGGPVPAPFPPPDYGCRLGRSGLSRTPVAPIVLSLMAAIGLRRRAKRRDVGDAGASGALRLARP
ncbi:MAG: hypothetical protein ABTD50_21955 [Polyangiaceae bacterium]|jgi:hypothetical protein